MHTIGMIKNLNVITGTGRSVCFGHEQCEENIIWFECNGILKGFSFLVFYTSARVGTSGF